jgi:hypothetical protein
MERCGLGWLMRSACVSNTIYTSQGVRTKQIPSVSNRLSSGLGGSFCLLVGAVAVLRKSGSSGAAALVDRAHSNQARMCFCSYMGGSEKAWDTAGIRHTVITATHLTTRFVVQLLPRLAQQVAAAS